MSATDNGHFELVDAPAPLPHNLSSDSALKTSIEKHRDNSYYHAHTRKFEIPEDAKVLKGPGIITGGFPEKISGDAVSPTKVVIPATALPKFSWMDETNKVRVYLLRDSIPDADLQLTTEVCTCTFGERSLNLEITGSRGQLYRLKFDNLSHPIDETKSIFRVSSTKVSITLQKKEEIKWGSLQASK